MGNKRQENFQEFYTEWIEEQKQEIRYLIIAVETSQQPQTDSPPPPPPMMSELVAQALAHYEKYYTTKSKFAETHALVLLSPPWTSQLEDAFIWVGGWRPTATFQLLYSKSSLQFEAKFYVAGCDGGAPPLDLGDLTAEQLRLVDELQRITVVVERSITEKVAKQQERVADSEMVELSHGVSEPESTPVEGEGIISKINSAVKLKEEGFQKILQSADDLRLRTLKGVIGILTPIQAVHFLIAAGELHVRLHEWGREKEERELKPCDVFGHVSVG